MGTPKYADVRKASHHSVLQDMRPKNDVPVQCYYTKHWVSSFYTGNENYSF